MRAKSAKAIRRAGGDGPISKYEEKYVKKFMNYMVKKTVENEELINDYDDNWNTTKIKSQNFKSQKC